MQKAASQKAVWLQTGYTSKMPLMEGEKAVLPALIMARCATSICLSSESVANVLSPLQCLPLQCSVRPLQTLDILPLPACCCQLLSIVTTYYQQGICILAA